MIRRPPRSTQSRSSAASDVYKRRGGWDERLAGALRAYARQLAGELLLLRLDVAEFRLQALDLGVLVFEGLPEGVALGVGSARLGSRLPRLLARLAHAPVVGRRGPRGYRLCPARGVGLPAERADEQFLAVGVDHLLGPFAGEERATALGAHCRVWLILAATEHASKHHHSRVSEAPRGRKSAARRHMIAEPAGLLLVVPGVGHAVVLREHVAGAFRVLLAHEDVIGVRGGRGVHVLGTGAADHGFDAGLLENAFDDVRETCVADGGHGHELHGVTSQSGSGASRRGAPAV